MNVHRILVGLDGSACESLVLAAAEDLALGFGASLLLVRAVVLPPEIATEVWQDPARSLKDELERLAREGLERCAESLCETLRPSCTFEVLVAPPWEALCLCAVAHAVDLIVIGSHGYGGLDRILGTTAARVVDRAPCSVFVVRAASAARAAPEPSGPRSLPHTTAAIGWVDSAPPSEDLVGRLRLELRCTQGVRDEGQEPRPSGRGDVRVPDGIGEHQAAPSKKRRHDFE
jgi:universal stress protein F